MDKSIEYQNGEGDNDKAHADSHHSKYEANHTNKIIDRIVKSQKQLKKFDKLVGNRDRIDKLTNNRKLMVRPNNMYQQQEKNIKNK